MDELGNSRYAGVIQSGENLYPVGQYIEEYGEERDQMRVVPEEEILEEFGIESDELAAGAIEDRALDVIVEENSRKYVTIEDLPASYSGEELLEGFRSASD